MFSFRSMTKDDEVTVLEMMKVFYDSPAVLHKTPIEVLKRDIEDCVGDMPFIEGYIAVAGDETAGYACATGEKLLHRIWRTLHLD